MKIDEARRQGLPLAMRSEIGGNRVLAEVFVRRGRLVFADIGWSDPLHSGHPFHEIEGDTDGDGPPWRVGHAEIRVMEHGDELADEYNRWLRYLSTEEGRTLATRERCEEALRERGLL